MSEEGLLDDAGNGEDDDGDERRARGSLHGNAEPRRHERHHDEATAHTHVARGKAGYQADNYRERNVLSREAEGARLDVRRDG